MNQVHCAQDHASPRDVDTAIILATYFQFSRKFLALNERISV